MQGTRWRWSVCAKRSASFFAASWGLRGHIHRSGIQSAEVVPRRKSWPGRAVLVLHRLPARAGRNPDSSIACRSERTRGVVTYSQSRPEVLPQGALRLLQGSGNQSLCRWHLLRPECDEPERHVLSGNSSLLIWSTSQAVIRSRSQRRIWNRSLPADFSRKSALGIGRSSNIEVPAALGLLAARYVGNRPNPLCWNDPFPFQQGIEAIGCEVLERLNFPGRPADLQRLNLLCRP